MCVLYKNESPFPLVTLEGLDRLPTIFFSPFIKEDKDYINLAKTNRSVVSMENVTKTGKIFFSFQIRRRSSVDQLVIVRKYIT